MVLEFWSIVSGLVVLARSGRTLTNGEKSTELRKWFGHDPAKWAGFRERYRKELAGSGGIDALKELAQRSRHKTITLVYGAADEQHNQAVALKEFIDQQA